MADNEFRVTWGVDDGYAGSRGRPHHFSIHKSELDGDMDEETLTSLFWDSIKNDFEQTIHTYSGQEQEFVEWAKEQIASLKANEDPEGAE